jgi:single-stranded DNA-binding protein
MMATVLQLESWYLNHVVIIGVISRYGGRVRTQKNGPGRARFDVLVQELGFDEKVHTTYLTVEAWGKVASQAGTLQAGAAVLIEGKLARARREQSREEPSDEWYTTVQAWRVQAFDEEETSP